MTAPWPALTNDTILLVAGLGRCGTSLMMQMLEAGGAPVVGNWPAYEPGLIQGLPFNAEKWSAVVRGRSVKALDPHRWQPPRGEDYRIIWLDRHPGEQARSVLKFSRKPDNRANRKGMERILDRDRRLAQQHLLSIDRAGILGVKFEDIINRPARVAAELRAKLGAPLDVGAMARQVVDRSPRCFDGLLENMLLITGRSK